MKPLSPRSRLKGDPFLPNRFIFGDAIDENGIEEYEYLIHTETPAFVCRIMRKSIELPANSASNAHGGQSAMLYDPDEDVSYYACSDGIAFTDFIFFQDEPTAGALKKICDEAMVHYWRLDEAYNAQREGLPLRPLRCLPAATLDAEELAQEIQSLLDSARQANQDAMYRPTLMARVHQALLSGDARVLTEAQLALTEQPILREALLNTARDLIAQPDIAREDGTFQPYDLWAMPLIYTMPHLGRCWYFPQLSELEGVLRETYGLGRASLLHVSPTVFSVEMLRESHCQQLVHVAPALDAGDAFIPEELEKMVAAYETNRSQATPSLVLAWVVFSVARGSLTPDKRPAGNLLLDVAMPVVENALDETIEYGEATLFAPEPLWESLATGTQEYNLRRLFFTVTVLEKSVGLEGIKVSIEYQPDQLAFQLSFKHAKGHELTGFAWLLPPDLAPDRDAALESLHHALLSLGLYSGEIRNTLH